jgi:excinuclease UvrABC helicase subunit UvrB
MAIYFATGRERETGARL